MLLLLVGRTKSTVSKRGLILSLRYVLRRHQEHLGRIGVVGGSGSVSNSQARLAATSSAVPSLVRRYKLHAVGLMETVGLVLKNEITVLTALTSVSACHLLAESRGVLGGDLAIVRLPHGVLSIHFLDLDLVIDNLLLQVLTSFGSIVVGLGFLQFTDV